MLNVVENMTLPMLMDGRAVNRQRLDELLDAGSVAGKKHSFNQPSGGSIGRALMNAPAVVLADEPTGNLDSKNSQEIVELLKLSNRKYGQTLVIITHDENIALQAHRIIAVEDGRITRDQRIRRCKMNVFHSSQSSAVPEEPLPHLGDHRGHRAVGGHVHRRDGGSLQRRAVSGKARRTPWGRFHGCYENVTEQQATQLSRDEKEIAEMSAWQTVGWGNIGSQNEYKPYLRVMSMDPDLPELVSIRLAGGRLPEKAGEILLPEHLLSNGNVRYVLGTPWSWSYHRRWVGRS